MTHPTKGLFTATHTVDETALLAFPFQHTPWLIMAKATAQSKPMPSSMCSMRIALGISLFRCTGQVLVMFQGQGNAPLFAIDNLPYNMKEALQSTPTPMPLAKEIGEKPKDKFIPVSQLNETINANLAHPHAGARFQNGIPGKVPAD